jgi:condensin complex subunit 2
LDDPAPPRELTDPNEARVFGEVVAGLERAYPKDKLEEISTSFCFICLLHLANERGLRVDSVAWERDEQNEQIEREVGRDKVGKLMDLRVSGVQWTWQNRTDRVL